MTLKRIELQWCDIHQKYWDPEYQNNCPMAHYEFYGGNQGECHEIFVEDCEDCRREKAEREAEDRA